MEWLALTMLCAFSLATTDACTKKFLSGYTGLELMLVRFFMPGLLLVPWIYFHPFPLVLPTEFWLWLCFLVPLELLAMFLYMLAIRDSPLYQTLPFLSFTPAFNILTAWIVLDEQITLQGAFGILTIAAGAYLLNIDTLNRTNGLNWLAPFSAIVKQKGSKLMLMVAAIYSLTSVGGKAAMLHMGAINFAVFYSVLVGASALLLVAMIQPKGLFILARKPGWHFIIGVMFTIMIITHYMALSKVEAAYMVAVKRTSLVFGILYGAWLFQEAGLFKNFAAVSLMVAGVALIVLH